MSTCRLSDIVIVNTIWISTIYITIVTITICRSTTSTISCTIIWTNLPSTVTLSSQIKKICCWYVSIGIHFGIKHRYTPSQMFYYITYKSSWDIHFIFQTFFFFNLLTLKSDPTFSSIFLHWKWPKKWPYFFFNLFALKNDPIFFTIFLHWKWPKKSP